MNETVNTHKKMEELDKMSIPYEAIPPSEWKSNAYDSNNSVSLETLCIFYKCARDLEKVIEEQEGDEKEVEEYIINLLSLILTQSSISSSTMTDGSISSTENTLNRVRLKKNCNVFSVNCVRQLLTFGNVFPYTTRP